MKRLFFIVTVFCLSLVSLKAEAINDKDFETFFAQFQKELKSQSYYDELTRYFASLIDKDVKLYSSCNDDDDCFTETIAEAIEFYQFIQNNKKYILQLNKKNKYEVTKYKKKVGKGEYDTAVLSISPDVDYETNEKTYRLLLNMSGYDGWGGTSISISFGKVKSAESGVYEWKIVRFTWAG